MTVNTTLMGLRATKPSFQVQVVARIRGQLGTYEQAGAERRHHFREMCIDPIILTMLKFIELRCKVRLASCQRQAVFPRQQLHHVTYLLGVLPHASEGFSLIRHATINEPFQSRQQTDRWINLPGRSDALKRLLYVAQRFEHSQPSRMTRTAVIVVQDAAHCTAIVEHRVATRPGQRRPLLPIGRRWLRGRLPRVEDCTLQGPQTTDFCTHFCLRRAVQVENRLGQVAKEVVLTIPVRHPGKFCGNALEKGVLLVRNPKHDVQPQRSGQVLARTNSFLISAVVPDSSGSANQTRLRVTLRTT